MILNNLIQEIDERGWNIKAVIVAKDKEIIEEHHRADKDELLPQYSVTKAFISTAVGILIDRGLINAEDKIASYIPEIDNSDNERLKQVKVRHLLSNSSGTDKGYLFEADRFTHNTDDYLSLIISKPLSYESGEKYVYSNSNFYLLSKIIENVTGLITDDFIKENILKPLEIDSYKAVRCPMGHFLGGSGLYLKTSDMIKLGIMLNCGGEYKGRKILSEDYISEAFSPQIRLNRNESYGYSFMMKDTRYVFVPGNFNQILFIDKREKYTVAVNSDTHPSETGTLMKVIRSVINSAVLPEQRK